MCYLYWPLVVGSSAVYGKLKVTLLSEENRGDYILRKMEITEKIEKEPLVV